MNDSGPNQSPSEEQIAIGAYLIWESEGRPEEMDKVHWDQAEAQMIASKAHDQWTRGHQFR